MPPGGYIHRDPGGHQWPAFLARHNRHRIVKPDHFAIGFAQAILDKGSYRLPGRIPAGLENVIAQANHILRMTQLIEQDAHSPLMELGKRHRKQRFDDRADVVIATPNKIEPKQDMVRRLEHIPQVRFFGHRLGRLTHKHSTALHSTPQKPRNYLPARQRRSNNEFDTTETELMAIAAPAITGLSIPKAAKGMPRTL